MAKKNPKIMVDELRDEVYQIKDVLDAWTESGLKKKTILILLAHYSGLGQKQVSKVLDALSDLDRYYFEDEPVNSIVMINGSKYSVTVNDDGTKSGVLIED